MGETASAGLERIAEIGMADVFNQEFIDAGSQTLGNIQGLVAGLAPIATGTTATGFVYPIYRANFQYSTLSLVEPYSMSEY